MNILFTLPPKSPNQQQTFPYFMIPKIANLGIKIFQRNRGNNSFIKQNKLGKNHDFFDKNEEKKRSYQKIPNF